MAYLESSEFSLENQDFSEFKVAIVVGIWHKRIALALLQGSERALNEGKVSQYEIFWVSGSFEIPLVAAAAATKFDAVVTLGVVIKGDTAHFDYICKAAAEGIMRVSLDSGKSVSFGVLTCDNLEQALDRAGLPESREDKGYEVTLAALFTARTLSYINKV